MSNPLVITVSREYCSAGRPIAVDAAKLLGIPCYDKELITIAAKESGLSEEAIAASEKQQTGSLLYSLFAMGNTLPLADQVFNMQSEIIRQLAEKESCIIVGRCADYILRDRLNTLRVFIHAPQTFRRAFAHNMFDTTGMTEKEIDAVLEQEDRRRSSYYNHYTDNQWGDMNNYDLTINSELGAQACAQLIAQAARIMEANNG